MAAKLPHFLLKVKIWVQQTSPPSTKTFLRLILNRRSPVLWLNETIHQKFQGPKMEVSGTLYLAILGVGFSLHKPYIQFI